MPNKNEQFVVSGSSTTAAIYNYICGSERCLKQCFRIVLRIVWFRILPYYINTYTIVERAWFATRCVERCLPITPVKCIE